MMNQQFELTALGGWNVPSGTEIPAGTEIPPHSNIKSKCIIGDGCIIGRETIIRSQCKVGDDCIIEHGCHLHYRCKVGARCQIGTMVSMNARVKLGRDCVWLGVAVQDWVVLSNIDSTGRYVKIIKHGDGFMVEGGEFSGDDAAFVSRAERNGQYKCAIIVQAVIDAMRKHDQRRKDFIGGGLD